MSRSALLMVVVALGFCLAGLSTAQAQFSKPLPSNAKPLIPAAQFPAQRQLSPQQIQQMMDRLQQAQDDMRASQQAQQQGDQPQADAAARRAAERMQELLICLKRR